MLILTSGFPPVVGGAESYAHTVATGLAERGHDVVVFTDGVESQNEETNAPFRLARAKDYVVTLGDTSKLRWEQMQFALLDELEASLAGWRPSVVFANNHETAILGTLVSESWRVPRVFSFHEHDPASASFGHGRLRLAYRLLAADAILAGSDFYAAKGRGAEATAPILHIPHGVDTETFRPDKEAGRRVRQRYALKEHTRLVVCAGRFKERKGQRELVLAHRSLSIGDVALLLCGTVSSASPDYLRELTILASQASPSMPVLVDTTLTRADMPEVLAAADVVAQPSHEEGLGLSVLEAMACGVPVVTCRVPGIVEILGQEDIAHIAITNNPSSLAERLVEVFADPAAARAKARVARAYVKAHFSQTAMLNATEAALIRVVAHASVRKL